MQKNKYRIRLLLFMLSCLLGLSPAHAQWRTVDYRYAPQWHVSCISYPDDTCKTLVGPLGQLLYDFGGKEFYPYANDRGFQTVVHLLADEGVKIGTQKLFNARVPIVTTNGTYAGMTITQEAMAIGQDYIRSGRSTKLGNREDLLLTTISNTTGNEQLINPVVALNTTRRVTVKGRTVTLTDSLGRAAHLYLSETVARVRHNLADTNRKVFLELAPVQVNKGETIRIAAVYDNGLASSLARQLEADPAILLKRADALRREIINYWTTKTDIPYDYIKVPDTGIQDLIDASLRGIWQARELKHDSIAFQVGPTCYRGLWIVDGAFLLEAVTMMGRGKDARQGIEYMLSFQQPDGGMRKMSDDYWKENGIVLWTCVQHALLTQDRQWLRSIWPQLNRIVSYIKTLRNQSLQNNTALDDGLIPPGEIDGGLWGAKDKPEYTNTYWNLIGLKAMIHAAEWIGREQDANILKKEYDNFYAVFQAAATRDLGTDDFGNRYIPVVMETDRRSIPQRAQWAFCQAVYPGQLFNSQDPLMTGTMNMLHNTLQEGMVMGTGWLIDGIWNYFASFYGHACLWMNQPDKAIESLYAFANHASPLYAWREEQNPRDLQAKYVGDMPHNWASAEFVRLAVHLLVLDRGHELHLLEGMPPEWLKPGMKTSVSNLHTVFGPVSFSVQVDAAGKNAILEIEKLNSNDCKAIQVKYGNWGIHDKAIVLDPSRPHKITIPLKQYNHRNKK
jgi:hypothetical protein